MKKKIMFAGLLTVFMLFSPGVSTANDAEVRQLIQDFFFNVTNGSSAGTQAFLTDPMLEEKQGQLENNPAYSAFLRKIYAGSTVEVTDISTVDENTKTADVDIYFKGESIPEQVRYVIRKEQDRWKISEEVTP